MNSRRRCFFCVASFSKLDDALLLLRACTHFRCVGFRVGVRLNVGCALTFESRIYSSRGRCVSPYVPPLLEARVALKVSLSVGA